MRETSALILMVLISQTYSAPQFITFKDGKLGVNFGGYHAGVGIGGLLGNGGAGGLYAEAGTPHGQAAMAGLGGYNANTGSAGGLYAGATAGGNVQAAAGLGGGIRGQSSSGGGFAAAQAGGLQATSGLGGQSGAAGSSGFTFSGTKSFGVPSTVVKETEISVVPVEVEQKKVHKEIKIDAVNEIEPLPLSSISEANFGADANIELKAAQPAVIVKEVYVEPQTQIVEKHIIKTHSKPHHHRIHNTAYIGGYVGGADTLQPAIQKRVDVGIHGDSNIGAVAAADAYAHGGSGSQTTITKEISVGRNPNFFQDIFNIPISTLQAVGNFLSNSAANTKVSVQKSATVQGAELRHFERPKGNRGTAGEHNLGASFPHSNDTSSPKHASSPLSSSSDAHISVETPSVSKIIDDIIAIPINTLGAVNKFLENNVPARKRIQVTQDGSGEPTRVRLGPHARRRANKHAVVVQEATDDAKPEGDNKQ